MRRGLFRIKNMLSRFSMKIFCVYLGGLYGFYGG